MKLYANGQSVLHVGDKDYKADKDGAFTVDHAHVDQALSLGATRHKPGTEAPPAPAVGDTLAQKVATLENTLAGLAPRLAALEGQIKDLQGRVKK